MKKYLFLVEKSSIANSFKKIYEKYKNEFGFDATFISFNASGWSRFDKSLHIDSYDEDWKADVSNLNLPNIFYILGSDNVKNVAETIDLNDYDEIISIVDPDIYGAILIHHFTKLKGIDCSFLKSIKLSSLTDEDIYGTLKNIKNAMSCENFVNELVSGFRKDLYTVDKNIFIFNSKYKICLCQGDLVLLSNHENKWTLNTEQVSIELNEAEMDKFQIETSLNLIKENLR